MKIGLEEGTLARCRLGAWDEVVGRLEGVRGTILVLYCTRRVGIDVGEEAFRKWRPIIRKGAVIGVISLDDGSVRVRVAEAEHHTRIPHTRRRRL